MPDSTTSSSRNTDLLRIKKNEKLISKLSSRESSISNKSLAVYYGEKSIGVPFMWELKPGTPKQKTQCRSASHATTVFSDIPPSLTPPPSSYYNASTSANHLKKRSNSNLLNTLLFPKLTAPHKKTNSFSSEISSASSSNNSTSLVSPSSFRKPRKSFSSMRWNWTGADYKVEDDDNRAGSAGSSPTSVLCFGIVGSKGKFQKSDLQV